MTEVLKVVRFAGIKPDTLGSYLAGLGLLAAVSKRWPETRGSWNKGTFILAGPHLTADGIEEYLRSEWKRTGYDRWWRSSKTLSQARRDGHLDQVRLLDAHVVVRGVSGKVFNPVMGTGGNVGRRDFTKVVSECEAALAACGERVGLVNNSSGL